jgi:hypothetical protein
MTWRMLVATAVIGAAKLIIANELTPGMSRDMTAMGHFRELADESAGVLIITHEAKAAHILPDAAKVPQSVLNEYPCGNSGEGRYVVPLRFEGRNLSFGYDPGEKRGLSLNI